MDKEIVKERTEKNSCIQCGKILEEFKESKFGGQVFKVCNEDCEKEFIKQMKEQRAENIAKAKIDLKMYGRELTYKKVQLDGTVIEKNESKIYIIRSFPKDDIKPKYVLECEMDIINAQIKQKKEEIKNMEELEDQDVKTS